MGSSESAEATLLLFTMAAGGEKLRGLKEEVQMKRELWGLLVFLV